MSTQPWTMLDLFTGIGGFSLAAEWTGRIRPIGCCEIDPWCRRVIAKHWPDRPVHDDVRTLTGDLVRGWIDCAAVGAGNNADRAVSKARSGNRLGEGPPPPAPSCVGGVLDLITGGYPCQPFSGAGKRLGQADDRHLWPEVARLVADLRPRWCLFENVGGHVSMGLDDVLADLESLGYACRAVVIPACAVNAPHRRDRVWIVAHAEDGGVRRGGASGQTGLAALGGEVAADTACDLRGASGDERRVVSDRRGRRQCDNGTEALGPVGQCPDGLSRGMVRPLSAWNGSWEAGIPRVTDHESDRTNKLKALGNAIVPQVAYVILSAMIAADDAEAA